MKAQDYFRLLRNSLGLNVAISATMLRYGLTYEQVVRFGDYGGGGVI